MIILSGNKTPHKISLGAIVGFLLTASLCALVVTTSVLNRDNVEKLEMEQLIMDTTARISEAISKLLYKTEALAALVVQGDGVVHDFERVAATLVDDPAILNVIVAPDGIVTDVYPLDGNEKVIGLDFFSEAEGNREALMARETGALVFGGPFTLVQGGQALVGRLPVYLNGTLDDAHFWGLVSVTLRYPEALDAVGLELLESQGYAHEIWRINPDNGERQVIAAASSAGSAGARFIEKSIPLLNADWYFRVSPVRMWYEYIETWVMIFSGLFISLLVAFVLQNNSELRLMKTELEYMSQVDSLTGIYNRRHFLDVCGAYIERSQRLGRGTYLLEFDLDHFKIINDTYGHAMGDAVLRETALRVKAVIRSYDLFARFGGEEFVVLVSDVDRDMAMGLAERLRVCVSEKPFPYEGHQASVTASVGVALVGDSVVDTAIRDADKALYLAKNNGRNQVAFYQKNED